MKKKSLITIFRVYIAEFISFIMFYLTLIGVIVGLVFGLENWKILIVIPFGCIFVAVATAWICALIQGKDE